MYRSKLNKAKVLANTNLSRRHHYRPMLRDGTWMEHALPVLRETAVLVTFFEK